MPKLKLPQRYLDQQLLIACKEGQLDHAQLAIAAGANVNWRTQGFATTPLHEAASNGHFAIAMLLIKAGANASAKNIKGTPPQAPRDDNSLAVLLADAVQKQQGHANRVTDDFLLTPQDIAKEQESHAARVTEDRKDKGPPQVGG